MVNEESKSVAVILKLSSLVESEGARQANTQEYSAQVFKKADAIYIRYVEELPDVGLISNTLKVEKNQVSIIRHGAIRMKHIYRLWEKTTSQYHTGHGAVDMEAETTRLDFQVFQDSTRYAQLTLAYELTMQSQPVGQFTLELNLSRQ